MRSHAGFLHVYSEEHKGTRFRVYLPARTETDADQPERPILELARGNGETVLVVDDEASIRQITGQTLEAFGYRVLLAADGAEAIAIYADHQSTIAVVLTDMMMPVLDGPATIQVLERMSPHVTGGIEREVGGMQKRAGEARLDNYNNNFERPSYPQPVICYRLRLRLRLRLRESELDFRFDGEVLALERRDCGEGAVVSL